MVAIDTETTGFDFRFGARPFFVTTCDDHGNQQYWEWPVDPLTRRVVPPRKDVAGIRAVLAAADRVVLHNSKFDATALSFIGVELPWEKVECTLVAGHLLASNQPHNLTDMAVHYLGVDIHPYEVKLKQACAEARRLARSKYPDWAIAAKGRPDMPSAGEEPWKADMWLPRAIALKERYPAGHPWYTVTEEYANPDSATTMMLWPALESRLKNEDLWDIYRESMRLPPVIAAVEGYGVTINRNRIRELSAEYAEESNRLGRVCIGVAESMGYTLELPKSGNNKSLTDFVFNVLNLEPHKWSDKTGVPSLDKECIEHYEQSLPDNSKPLTFIKCLSAKRSRDTAVGYMESYHKFGVPVEGHEEEGWCRVHPNLNQTGTDTTRSSSSNPNEQSVSRKKDFNLRYCFGPAPGREWYSFDANNLEMVIPAFEAGEQDLIRLFTSPGEAPYFGSYHLMIFDTLHPALFKKHGTASKDLFKATWYKYTKNGNFAKLYGGQRKTVDRAYHVPGGYDLVDRRLPRIAALNAKMIAAAEKSGYVETIPDKSVNPRRGYPLMCTRTEWAKILPTVPLNYHVQGTGGWWKRKAMVRVHEFLSGLNTGGKFAGRKWPGGYYLIMDVHDELVVDFPREVSAGSNSPVVNEVKRLMELGGADIGVPIKVSAEYHPDNWSTGVSI